MMVEYINTQEIVVVWNSREETNRRVSLFLALKPKFLAEVASSRRGVCLWYLAVLSGMSIFEAYQNANSSVVLKCGL